MSRRTRSGPQFTLPQLFVVGLAILIVMSLPNLSLTPEQVGGVLLIVMPLLLLVIFGLVAYIEWQRFLQTRAIRMSQIDQMSGEEFELYLAKLMQSQGYKAQRIGGSGDLGVDLIAEKDGCKWAVQAKKRQSAWIDRTAVSDAVAAKAYYSCDRAMVITNSFFKSGAEQLAKANECVLIDRTELSKWIRAWQIVQTTR